MFVLKFFKSSRFGELKALANKSEQVHLRPENIITSLKKQLRYFNDKDYLLLLGDPALIGAAMIVASNSNNGNVKVLKWDRIEKMYYPVKLSF